MLVQRLDEGESAFFNRELEHVIARLFEVDYPELLARSLIPVNGEAGPGAEVITYRQIDKVGMATLVADYADNIPRVDVLGTEFTSPVRGIASSFGYSIQEIRAAVQAGRSLRDMKARAAREADEQKLDSIASFGDANSNLSGFLNNTNVPTGTATNPGSGTDWDSKTPAEIIVDMQQIVASVRTATNSIESPDTLLLPDSSFVHIAQTQMPGIPETILSFFLRTSPYINNIQPWYRLETAGAADSKRMVAYRRDPDKLELHIPQDYEVFAPEQDGLEFVSATHMRVGGVTIYKPMSMRYVDGI